MFTLRQGRSSTRLSGPRRGLPAVALAGALLAGCGAPPPITMATASPTPASPSSAAAAAWMEKFCTVMLEAPGKAPKDDPDSPRPMMELVTGYVSANLVALDKAIGALQALGPAPTPSGDALITLTMPMLVNLRNTFATVKKNLATTDPTDHVAIARAQEPLANIPLAPDPMKVLKADPVLNQAAQESQTCRKLFTQT